MSTGYEAANYPANILCLYGYETSELLGAKNGIIKEFTRLTTELVPEQELAVAKLALKGSYLMEHETNADQSRFLGSYELLKLGYQFDDVYPQLIDKVTAEDVKGVAAQYFQHYALSVILPGEIKK